MMMVCRNCGKTTCACIDKGRSSYYAPSAELSTTIQSVKEGKLFSVIPTAIDNLSVIRVHPTKDSKYDIQPDPKELQSIKKMLDDKLKQFNSAKSGPKKGGTADKIADAIKGLL